MYIGINIDTHCSRILCIPSGAVLFGLVAVFLPETLRKKKDVEKKQAAHRVFHAFLPMIGMLGDPTILVITAYSTVIFGCLYLLVILICDIVVIKRKQNKLINVLSESNYYGYISDLVRIQ